MTPMNLYFVLKNVNRLVLPRLFSTEPVQTKSSAEASCNARYYFHPTFEDEAMRKAALEAMSIHHNFITPEEEVALVDEVTPKLKRMRYELDHWDNVIYAYKETEFPSWRPENAVVMDRVRRTAFPAGTTVMGHVHVLELRKDGYIKPHVDAVRFCGDTVAGLCCLSSSVMRFRHEKRPELVVDFLLPRRGLYVMTGVIRYEFTHEILAESESKVGDEVVPRDKRIAIICRDPPKQQQQD